MADVSLLFNILARDNTGAGLSSASSGMEKFKARTSMAALGILGAATAIGAKSISIASDTAESASKVATLFGKSSASIGDFASRAATSYGMSKAEAYEAVGAMGAVQIAMGVNADQAAKTSVEYTKLAADLGSFNNASSEEVADALTNSLSGEYEMLKKYGIVVNDTTLAAEAQRIGMVKTGSTWTTAQKQQLSYNIIMASTKKAQGDFARTSDGMANQTKKLQATVTNLQGSLGEKLLPVVVKVMSAMNDAFGWMERHQTTTKVLAITVGTLATAIVGLAVGMKVVAAATALNAGAWRLLATVMWANPVFIIAGIIIAIGAALVVAYMKCETFRNVVNTAFGAVKTFVVSAFQVLSNTILGFWGMVIHGAAKAFGWVPGIGDKLKAADAEFTKFRDSVNAKLNAIKGPKPIHIAVTDDTAAAATRVRNLKSQVEGGGWSIAIKTSGPAAGVGVRLPARAAGGPVTRGGTYLVGEDGPEVVTMGASGFVTPNSRIGALGGAGGGGGGVLRLEIDVRGDDEAEIRRLRKSVRIRGGNVQAVLGSG